MKTELLMVLALLACGVSALLTWRFSLPGSRFYLLDHPNERSLHTRPTPRTGGIAIVLVCLLAGAGLVLYAGQAWQRFGWLGLAILLSATISFSDDRFGLTATYRIAAHVMVAAALWVGGFALEMVILPGVTWVLPVTVSLLVTLLYIVWMMNLYNFMDGMDGFAAGMALVGFGTYALFGFLTGHWLFAGLNLVVAAAATGFLFFNFPPARIFMGDTGSSNLGLLAACFSLWGAQAEIFPFWITVLVFSPFIVDATVTLLRRGIAREKIWQAHKTHYYQRLVQLGWGHRRTVLWEYVVMTACAISALLVSNASPDIQWTVIGFWAVAYTIMALAVRYLERKRSGESGEIKLTMHPNQKIKKGGLL